LSKKKYSEVALRLYILGCHIVVYHKIGNTNSLFKYHEVPDNIL
jgi:hypothetical protein